MRDYVQPSINTCFNRALVCSAEEDELTFDPDEEITNIEFVSSVCCSEDAVFIDHSVYLLL